jgi:hypothetical protein
VEEQIGSGAVLDETETLVSQPLDRTFRHRRSSSATKKIVVVGSTHCRLKKTPDPNALFAW